MSGNWPSSDVSCYHDACSSPSILDSRASTNNLSRKRKRLQDSSEDGQSKIPIFRIDLPSNSSAENSSAVVTPLFLFPRASLPLSSLDLNPSDISDGAPSRLFTANIPALEAELTQPTSDGPVVLIARINGQKQDYAIEGVSKGVFAICRLHSKTDVEVFRSHLQRLPKRKRISHTSQARSDTHGRDWWSSAVLEINPTSAAATPCVKEIQKPVQLPAEPATPPRKASSPFAVPKQSPHSLPETHLSIVQQYLEALYLSKACLAFFAKGPLSRARAAHGPHDQEHGGPKELAEYLRLMILSASTTETKYRSAIMDILKSSSEVDTIKWPAKPGKRAVKPAKDGVYKFESQHIRRWWNDHCDRCSGTSGENNLNQALRALRFRESCLQIIMILEISSLETPLASSCHAGESTSNAVMNGFESQQNQPKRRRKPQDLNLSLELLLDRLCIWQSIELDGDIGLKNPELDARQGDQTGASEGDGLREFCLEVIIPLYNNRLPSVVKDISKRVGVSIRPSPRADKRKANSKHEKVAPGTKIQRKPPAQQSNELDAKIKKPAKPATLSRSTSDVISKPPKTGHDVESQEPLIEARHRRSMSRASSMTTSKKLNQREVDMSAITRFNESKNRKKAAIDQELHDAIATLKKPNREQAVRDYVDAAERRGILGNAQPNKPYKLGLAAKRRLNVQVDATPMRKDRTRREIDNAVPAQPTFLEASPTSQPMIPSTNPFVPSSSKRMVSSKAVSQPNLGTPRTSTIGQKSRFRDAFETPSRPSDKKRSSLAPSGASGFDTMITSSGIKQTPREKLTGTTSNQEPRQDCSNDEDELQADTGISSTPLMQRDKRSQGSQYINRDTEGSKRAGLYRDTGQKPPDCFEEPGGQSIYNVLGWDDDIDP
ncbi:MAG: hypothetical protein M1831_003025 [Alyxoria varia]|nr:MAG: hypothetical protein M1831_003025 [Alyxoria varia]